jgi:hypothetical protein
MPGKITATVPHFAKASDLGVSTVWKMVKDNVVETVVIGRRRLIVIESYHRLIERQRAIPVSAAESMPEGGRGRRKGTIQK